MKNTIWISLFLLFVSTSCTTQKRNIQITVANPLAIDRKSELVEISIDDLKTRLPLEDGKTYLVINKDGDTIASQITYDNKLIFIGDLGKEESSNFTIASGKQKEYSPLVRAKHYPERYGDLAWENDRLGFRFYGAPLIEVQAPTSGLDLWYKRTNRLVLDDWYRKDISKEASYHVDHGEGCDPYAVGQTLGGGSMAIVSDDLLYLNKNFNSFEILDNGPLRSTFCLVYPTMVIDGDSVQEEKIISLDAGSQLSKIAQKYTTNKPLKVAAGFPKRAVGDSVLYTEGNNYMIYEEPKDAKNGQIYLAVLFPKGIDKVKVTTHIYDWAKATKAEGLSNIVAEASYSEKEPIIYYTGFGWNKFGFDSSQQFNEYVENYNQALENKFTITY